MTTRSTQSKLSSVIWESKCTRVMFQKHDKMTNRISSQVLVLVKSSVFIEYVASWFDGILTIRTPEFFIREEPKSVFTYRYMISDCSGSSCAEKVEVTEVLKLWTSSDIRWLKQIIITINEVEKMIVLQVWCLERHLPFTDEVITFNFLAKVPREFTWKDRSWPKRFGFSVNDFVEMPITMTWAFPKFNMILWMTREESLEIFQDGCQIFLEGIRRQVKNYFHCMDWVCDNNDFGDVADVGSLVDATSNYEKFSFSTRNV